MASNSFGNIFKITTWGESHGKAIGVVVDGCPAGLQLSEEDINEALLLRGGGRNAYTTQRKETDSSEILSGVFEGITTGTPISIMIWNKDANSSHYEAVKDLFRPGHANFTYLEKYGIFDHRGGGRASGRETACRVAAGVIAKKLLRYFGITAIAYLKQVGDVAINLETTDIFQRRESIVKSPIFCPHEATQEAMIALIEKTKQAQESIGGKVGFIAWGIPPGLGDPTYEKLPANLAKGMFTIPAVKGFELGSGFESISMQGSFHNDSFYVENEKIVTKSNRAGGTLGGISTGMPLTGSVAFKPTSSILQAQQTVNLKKEEVTFQYPDGSRHDPCIAIRAVPVVEAMLSLVLADALLLNRSAKL